MQAWRTAADHERDWDDLLKRLRAQAGPDVSQRSKTARENASKRYGPREPLVTE